MTIGLEEDPLVRIAGHYVVLFRRLDTQVVVLTPALARALCDAQDLGIRKSAVMNIRHAHWPTPTRRSA